MPHGLEAMPCLAVQKGALANTFKRFLKLGGRRSPGGDRKAPWSPPQRRNPLPYKKQIFQKIPKAGGRRFPKGKAGIAARKVAFSFGKGNPPTADWLAAQGAGNQPRGYDAPAFLNRNERRNAATIEVAERSEGPLVAPRLSIPSIWMASKGRYAT